MMQIIGAAAATEAVSRRDLERNNLEYVWMKVGSEDVLNMVDSGAIHNFMSEYVARRIGLKCVPMQAQIKMVNSPLDCMTGVAKKVDTTLGEWIGKANFTIVWIDDYEFYWEWSF